MGERQVYAGDGGAQNPKVECRTGHWKQNNHVCGPYFSTFSRLLQIYCAKTYRFLLWANVKSMRATAGTKEKLSSFRTFFSLDLLPSLFQLCWLNFIDIFFGRTSSLCGRRRAQKKNCQVCAPFYLSISFSFPTFLAKLYRSFLRANVKSARATAGHQIRRIGIDKTLGGMVQCP